MKLQEEHKTLVFFVNGKKIVDSSIDPEVTLLTYIRKKLFLTGSKEGCSEGGCGACTVMLSWVDRSTNSIQNMSANACLLLAASVHGMAVTTVEGIGSIKALHPVQERLAKTHGSQCGFCSPGFVMSMYTLLRNTPTPSFEEIEENLVGNLCRCTGYRPILDSFRTFSDPSIGCGKTNCCKIANGANKEGDALNGSFANGTNKFNGNATNGIPGGGCGKGNKCCKSSTKDKNTQDLFKSSAFSPYSPSQDTIFPPELKASEELDLQELHFKGPRVEFFRPLSLQTLLSLKARHPEARLVAGNTEIGVEVKYKGRTYPILIDISKIQDLKQFAVEKDGIIIGASLSMSDVERKILEVLPSMQEFTKAPFNSVLDMISLFAGKQVRNRGTFGGNVVTGSPISDLVPILVASGSTLQVQSLDGEGTYEMDHQFYTGYRTCKIQPNEVVTSIKIPFTRKYEFFKWYKQSRRVDDDIAIANAAFKVKFTEGTKTVESIKMAYGGMDKKIVVPLRTMMELKGLPWSDALLEKAASSLSSELELDPGAPGGMVEYRQAISLSLFQKFHLLVRKLLNRENDSLSSPLTKAEDSELDPLKYEPLRSTQFIPAVPTDQDIDDPVGRAIPAVSNLKIATGEAEYVDDIPHMSTELSAAFVTSTIGRGTIGDIDPSDALKLEGVEAFYCHKDIPAARNFVQRDEEMFASKEVYTVGQVIGIILATDQDLARRAAKLVKVKFSEIKKPIITIKEAIEANAVWDDPVIIRQGKPEEAFEASEHKLEGEFYVGGQEHFYLETNSHLVIPKDADEFEIYCPTQLPFGAQISVATALQLPFNKVHIKVRRIGGAFGGKCTRSNNISATIAFAAQKIQRPVRTVLDRWEDMQMTGGRHPMLAKWKVGFQKDGKVNSFDAKIYSSAGWSLDMSKAVFEKGIFMMHGPYNLTNRNFVGICCKTNLPSNTAFRGFGVPQCVMIVEEVMTRISDFLQMEHKQVKERNISPPSVPENDTEQESTYITECWKEVLRKSNYDERRKNIKKANSESKTVKRGMAIVPLSYAIGFGGLSMQQAGALVNIYTDGSVLLCHGGVEMGQGLQVKMLQIAARVLEIPIERIFTSGTGTDNVPNAPVSAGSFSSDLNGMAVLEACQKIRDRLAPIRKNMLKGTWNDWVKAAYADRVSLSATGFYKAPGVTDYDYKEQKGNPFSYRTNGAAVSEVEVDCLTGNFKVSRTDIVMDIGKSLNPGVDMGQIEGGFLQGMGWLTYEELKYSPDGPMLTLGPGMYKIPGVRDIPRSFNVSLLANSTNTKAVYSSKGIGEPPLLLASSVFFAIREAVKDYREANGFKGPFIFDAPATAEKIRMACQDSLTRRIKSSPEGSYRPWSLSP